MVIILIFFRDFMKEKYGGIDILVNNAGIMFPVDAKEHMGMQAEVTCRTNYWSTKNVCDILFPILKAGARVVNVSSSAGKVANMKESPIKAKFISSGNTLTVSVREWKIHFTRNVQLLLSF